MFARGEIKILIPVSIVFHYRNTTQSIIIFSRYYVSIITITSAR